MGVLNVLLLLGGGHLRGLIGMVNLQLHHPFLPAPLWIATVDTWGFSSPLWLLAEWDVSGEFAICLEMYEEDLVNVT